MIDWQKNGSISCIAFTAQGALVARKIAAWSNTFASLRPKDAIRDEEIRNESVGLWTEKHFYEKKALIFVGATGIAVRAIAKHLRSKDKDPAIIVIDENARFVISLLSGHLGGANELTALLSDLLGATAVISTATDNRKIFAVDDWARVEGHAIENKSAIVLISSALLEGRSIGFFSDSNEIEQASELPNGLEVRKNGELGVCVSTKDFIKERPFLQTLFVRPRVLTLGIGCKRNTPCQEIESAVFSFLKNFGFSFLSVMRVASVDLKADEAGLIDFCEKHSLEFSCHSAEELMNVKGNDFSRSEFVKNTVGVDCVCERAAAMYGNLLIKKQRFRGITLALSCADWRVRF